MTTQTLTLSPARALALAIQAIEYHAIGGSFTPDTFNSSEAWAAWTVLIEQEKSHRGAKRKALQTARQAVRRAWYRLRGHRTLRAINARRLREAVPVIVQMLEQSTQEEDAYWQDFTAGALGEVEAIWGGEK